MPRSIGRAKTNDAMRGIYKPYLGCQIKYSPIIVLKSYNWEQYSRQGPEELLISQEKTYLSHERLFMGMASASCSLNQPTSHNEKRWNHVSELSWIFTELRILMIYLKWTNIDLHFQEGSGIRDHENRYSQGVRSPARALNLTCIDAQIDCVDHLVKREQTNKDS